MALELLEGALVIETIYGTNNGTSLIILAESCFWGIQRQGRVASTPLHIAQLQGQVEIAVTVRYCPL